MPRRRGLSDAASTGGYKPKPKPAPKPRKPSGQLVPSTRHPFDIVPPTRAQKIGRKAVAAPAPDRPLVPPPRGRAGAPPTPADVYKWRAREAHARGLISAKKRDHMIREASVGLPLPFTQIANALIQSPGGLYHLAKDAGLDVYDFVRMHNLDAKPRTLANAEAMAHQIGQDFTHPGGRLGYLGLDLLAGGSAAAGLVGRVGAASRTLGETGSRAAAARAALRRPVPPLATAKFRDLEVSHPYLDNPLIWPIQRRYRQATPQLNERRVGQRLTQEQRVRQEQARALPQALVAQGQKATLPQQAALTSIYEGTHPLERAAQEVKWARRAKNVAERHRHMKLARLYRTAAHYVDETDGALVISDSGQGRRFRDKLLRKGVSEKDLKALYEAGKSSAGRRQQTLIESGDLSPEGAAFRLQGPGEVVTTGQKLGPREETTLEHTGGEVRVPSTSKRRGMFGTPRRPTTGAVGFPKKEGALTHGYTGGLRVRGLERQDTPRLIAESELISQKFRTVLANRERLLKAASPEKLHEDDVAIRTDALKGKALTPEAQVLLDRAEAGGRLTSAEKANLGKHWNAFVKQAFPDEIAPQKGIVWVPRHIADGIMPEAELGGKIAKAGKVVSTGTDFVNNMMKMGLLTLKGPGYLLPNLIGQTFLGLVHQGVHLPGNLAAMEHLRKTLSTEDWTRLKAEGGSGIARVLESRGRLDLRAQSWLVGLYETVLDTPFRTSGLLHEMKRRGVDVWDDKAVADYLNHPENEMVRQHVSHYAREAYIDFGKLGPFERTYVTRAFFLYPWLKGSARYTLRYLVEHPVQAATLVKLGEQQIQRNKKELGNPKNWITEAGIFKVGGTDALPSIVNPQAAGILGQFPQLLLEAQKDPAGAPFKHLSPTLSLALAIGLKYDPYFQSSLHGSRGSIALQQTLGQFPLFQVAHPGPQPPAGTAVYPGDRRTQAIQKLILGSAYPRTLNRARAQAPKKGGKGKSGRWDFSGPKSGSSRWDFGGTKKSGSSSWDFGK